MTVPVSFYSSAVFIDTSAFVALFNQRDSSHQTAVAIGESLNRGHRRWVTSNFVIAETHAVLLARANHRIATEFLLGSDRSNLQIERTSLDDEAAAKEIIRGYRDKRFSYVDAISFAIMRRLGIEVAFALDSDFQEFGFRPARP